MSKRLDLTGQRFGRLEVLADAPSNHRGNSRSLCLCKCGGVTVVVNCDLKKGHVKSCGCLHREAAHRNGKARTVHGGCGTPAWNSWQNMLRRCYEPANKDYHSYGGRGVVVCSRWDPKQGGSFQNFLDDMGERPEGMTLDKDIKGGIGCLSYSPENCCWATPVEQAMYRRERPKN